MQRTFSYPLLAVLGALCGCGASSPAVDACGSDSTAWADLPECGEDHAICMCDEAWANRAEELGWPAQPGGDFFAYATQGCVAMLVPDPPDMAGLAERSSLVAFGRIERIVTRSYSATGLTSKVYFRVALGDVLKGDDEGAVLVNEPCVFEGKVAGLMTLLPEEPFLFFLDGPWRIDEASSEQPGHALAGYQIGVVRERPEDGVPEFAYAVPPERAALLAPFQTMAELVEAVGSP